MSDDNLFHAKRSCLERTTEKTTKKDKEKRRWEKVTKKDSMEMRKRQTQRGNWKLYHTFAETNIARQSLCSFMRPSTEVTTEFAMESKILTFEMIFFLVSLVFVIFVKYFSQFLLVSEISSSFWTIQNFSILNWKNVGF